jgi:putative protein-disulfide isomerase
MDTKLIYVHDPMCSWCWGYANTWLQLKAALRHQLPIEYRVGGLAPDSQELMPDSMQQMLEGTWHKISAQLGTQFNHAFWRDCQPRRSTYPACRAALIARKENKEAQMIAAIQHAYYLQAQNPSDESTLITLAEQIGLDKAEFTNALLSTQLNDELNAELNYVRSLPIQGFPSLVLITDNKAYPIAINYADWQKTLHEINTLLN